MLLTNTIAVVASMLTPVSAQPAPAVWNDTGHSLVALIAYRQLSLEQQLRLQEILRAHPRFKADFAQRMPSTVTAMPFFQQARWYFAQAATWPDLARELPVKFNERFHHSTWHYVHHPVFLSPADRDYFQGSPAVNTRQDWIDGMLPFEMNIVQALKECRARLNTSDVLDPYKAVYLCWLLHLVGDIHQPLHAAALFSRERFPGGDQGGNLIGVGYETNLHRYWDAGVGSEPDLLALNRTVKEYLADEELVESATAQAGDLDFGHWRDESFALAKEHGYTEEVLTGVREADAANAPTAHILLSDEYKDTAAEVSRRRVVTAGFRLARTLQELDGL